MIQLSPIESLSLRSQNATLKGKGRRQHRKFLPFAFAEQGTVTRYSRLPSKKGLNEQVGRNQSRFPSDFMFQLNERESLFMRSQIATANKTNLRYKPYAFTENGIAMLSSVLNSERAIQVNIAIMRAFVRLREMASTHRKLSKN